MEQLPNLGSLSHGEKSTIIHLLFETVLDLRSEVATLRAENAGSYSTPSTQMLKIVSNRNNFI